MSGEGGVCMFACWLEKRRPERVTLGSGEWSTGHFLAPSHPFKLCDSISEYAESAQVGDFLSDGQLRAWRRWGHPCLGLGFFQMMQLREKGSVAGVCQGVIRVLGCGILGGGSVRLESCSHGHLGANKQKRLETG